MRAAPEPAGNGSRIDVRPIEPSDAAALLAAFDVFSESSRYERFFTPTSELSESALYYLTEV